MLHCSDRIGDAYFRTPRNTITAFVNLLAVIEQNPGTGWRDLVGTVEIGEDGGDDMGDIDEDGGTIAGATPRSGNDDDDLTDFRL